MPTSETYHVNLAFENANNEGTNANERYGAIDVDKPKVASKSEPREVAEADVERDTWGNKCDFFLSALGYAVGLGNVWRFPKLAYDHGGGSFLVPYSIMLLLAGLPLFFMELALGQYSGAGPTRLFGRLAPAMKGLGFAMLCATFFVAIYYNVIIAWTLYYTFASFQQTLPWIDCGHDYNTERCYDGNLTRYFPSYSLYFSSLKAF